MKKLVMIKKKKIKVLQSRKRRTRLLGMAATLLLFLGTVPAIGVQAQPQEEVSYIYHKHIGNSGEKGGCYQQPVYHVHAGNETEGGACYETPVYHVHEGNEAEGGSCYLTPVYHQHAGDETTGGDCYEPIYHTHTEACYQKGTCHIDIIDFKDREFEDKYCAHHRWTSHATASVTYRHRDCGRGDEPSSVHYCRTCGRWYEDSHEYSRCICSLGDNYLTGYRLNCTKTPETIDRYEVSCEKQADFIESYGLSCTKSQTTVDSYEIDCGYDETIPCGRIVVTNQTTGTARQVELHVEVEDLTEGKLNLSENPYYWKDGDGNPLGEGDTIHIQENGSYTVAVNVENEDIDKERLQASIQVNNVGDNKEEVQQEKENDREESDSGSQEETSSPDPSPTVTPTASPTTEPTEQDHHHETSEETKKAAKGAKPKNIKAKETPSTTPLTEIKKEKVKVDMPESKSLNQTNYEPVQIEKNEKAALAQKVKIISITVGGLIAIGGMALFGLIKLKCIKLYNDDGKGRMTYIGICMVKETQEGFVITLSDTLTEKACTNRYCIHPGLFRLGKKKDQELIICRQEKRISIRLAKEMFFLI